MILRCLTVALFLSAASLFAGQDAPATKEKPLTREERPMEWLIAVEKLRDQPRPGDVQNAGILANIADVVETTPEQKKSITDTLQAYDKALVQKAAQWEQDMKATRAEYEAKIIAALPEARRDAARKALEYSHEQWTPPFEFEARLRSDFLQKKAKAEEKGVPAEEADAARKEFMGWIKDQRVKAQAKNAEVVKTLKAMLDAKEAERLGEFDKNKEVPAGKKPAGK